MVVKVPAPDGDGFTEKEVYSREWVAHHSAPEQDQLQDDEYDRE
ncbi:hypothetical protein SK355_11600 (plasmid) [Candidatus Fukatsuia symbiotica]|nr:hypothetical protein [Candidatus Fukatsuia symbiotica]MEA9445823.1 hypothetical protein [Candidatus Fukatsuia symbiotica]